MKENIIEYVWIDGVGELRSKIRVHYSENFLKLREIPIWNYDGSSTCQAHGEDSEVIIKPCSMFFNPLITMNRKDRDVKTYIVMCETFKPSGEPLENNHRNWANKIFEKDLEKNFKNHIKKMPKLK